MYIFNLIVLYPNITSFIYSLGVSVKVLKYPCPSYSKPYHAGPPGVLGIWGEWLFIFRELGSTGHYFRGAREQAHNFRDSGSLAKKQKNMEKPPFCWIF